jgi:polysulfide reductase-like protein
VARRSSPKLSSSEREERLTLIRQKAEQQGLVPEPGIRPLGAPFPHARPDTGYYGLPLFKEPQWTWQVPLYFFSGGAAGASAVIATFAEVFSHDQNLARQARWLALGGIGVSAVLLISDLGRPDRFLGMLRVFKPQSPMSMGAWLLNAFGSTTTAAVLADAALDRFGESQFLHFISATSKALSCLCGLPFSNYTGVLIGATVIPVWNRNIKTLPIHFGASGLEASVSMLELLGHETNPSLNLLGVGAAAWETWEGVHLERRNEPELAPLKQGRSGWITRIGGLLSGPLALGLRIWAGFSTGNRSRKLRRMAAAVGIAGSVLTRYGWVEAGHVSARRTIGENSSRSSSFGSEVASEKNTRGEDDLTRTA